MFSKLLTLQDALLCWWRHWASWTTHISPLLIAYQLISFLICALKNKNLIRLMISYFVCRILPLGKSQALIAAPVAVLGFSTSSEVYTVGAILSVSGCCTTKTKMGKGIHIRIICHSFISWVVDCAWRNMCSKCICILPCRSPVTLQLPMQ